MVPPPFRSIRAVARRAAALLLPLIALAQSGCSFDLGSLSPDKEKPPPIESTGSADAVSGDAAREAREHTTKAQTMVRAGQSQGALEEFNRAITLDPYSAEALYGRALIYQANNQHDFAIADFSSASGLNPQKPEPLLGRAISYLAIGNAKAAAADLDEASQTDPNNAQIWTTRGHAYERLGDRAKAAESYARATALRPRDEGARAGLSRVGG